MTAQLTTDLPADTFRMADWLIPAALIALAFIPIVAGAVRLTTLATGAAITPDNARFFASPIPVVFHIISVTIYCLLGAFQFSPGFRRRHPTWHRTVGKILVGAGLAAALSGIWMAQFYAIVPADSALLHAFRLFFGSAMAVSIVMGYMAVRRRKIGEHQAWMRRAYAIGQGAGTQALTQIPLVLILGKLDANMLAFAMGGAWLLNLAVAEWLIQAMMRPARAVDVVTIPAQRSR
jgi:uncharacterized membrane protein